MNKEHHNKIIIIAVVFIAIVAVVLGVAAIRGKKNGSPAPDDAQIQERQRLIDATSAKESSSISDPESQKLIKSTSAPKSAGGGGDREALIRATSGQ